MPDSRNHRGAHPDDARDFGPDAVGSLRAAVVELSYLMERHYAHDASLKLVGDHHQLTVRQRKAVSRGACSDSARTGRSARRVQVEQLRGRTLAVDGFNCLITMESSLSGAPLFRGRDGALRDLASVHGTYRSVDETLPAATRLVELCARQDVARALILLDRPVGNSGRTRALFEQACDAAELPAEVLLSDSVDRELVACGARGSVVASSDSWILDRAEAWVDLPLALLATSESAPWLIDFTG
jgi:hypothetical protein